MDLKIMRSWMREASLRHSMQNILRMLLKCWIPVKHVIIWVLVNFIVCTLPIIITIGIEEVLDGDIVLAIMSFSFTLLMSNLYLRGYADMINSITTWLVLLYLIVSIVIYSIYQASHEQGSLVQFISNNLEWSIGVLLLITAALSLFLNTDLLKDKIQKDKASSIKRLFRNQPEEELELRKGVTG